MKQKAKTIILKFGLIIAYLGFLINPLASGAQVAPVQAATNSSAPAAPTTTLLTLRVESARQWAPSGLNQGDAIPHYHWLVTQNDVGDTSRYGASLAFGPGNSYYDCTPQSVAVVTPDGITHPAGSADPAYPANCQWPSIHAVKGGTTAQVIAQGDETTLNQTLAIDTSTWPADNSNPNHSYMISVTAGGYTVPGCTVTATVNCHVDGFKVDGTWFNSPLPGSGLVTVDLQPYPLPLATVRMEVWNDLQTNGAYDTGEPYLPGFQARISDIAGVVSNDWYGNPICSTYEHDPSSFIPAPAAAAATSGQGKVSSATALTVVDTTKTWTLDQWEQYEIKILTGTGAGQIRNVVSNDGTSVTIDSAWTTTPDATSTYSLGSAVMIFDVTGHPVIEMTGGKCFSDANGMITIPYLPPNRYSAEVIPPAGQTWYQTTTLEGWLDWDTWALQGWNGYDPEFVQGAEPFPFAEFGFVQVQNCAQAAANPSAGQTGACPAAVQTALGANASTSPNSATGPSTGLIKGRVVETTGVSPAVGGIPFGGAQGNIILGNLPNPIISLIDTNRNDNTVYVGVGNADGTFQINNVPDSDYVLTYFDASQAYLLTQANVSIVNGQAVDLGSLDAGAWWANLHGRVCDDIDRDGKCTAGDPGIPNLTLNLLGRDNSLQPAGDSAAVTDANGNYNFPRTYVLGQFVVEQGYWEQYYTVGVTYQSINQKTETTVMANGGFVDISTLNQIGMQTRVDWAIHPYETDPTLGPTTGGIVGEMVYNTTRIESDARFNTSQPNEPGIPNFTVHLYWPVPCDPTTGLPTNPSEPYTAPVAGTSCTSTTTSFGTNNYLTSNADGSLIKGPEAQDPYTSETWARPQNCVARDANGVPVQEQVLPPSYVDANGNPVQSPIDPSTGKAPLMHDCLEAPLMESQVSNNTFVDATGQSGDGQYVNGNYGFTQIKTDINGVALPAPITIPSGDWIVSPESQTDVNGAPVWRASMEEDVNIFSGDQFVAPGETPINPPVPAGAPVPTPAPAIPPFPCIGPNHTVNVVSDPTLAHFDPANPSTTSGVYNPDYLAAAAGGPYQGQQKPLCTDKLVTVRPLRSATPNFYWQPTSDVPLPTRIFGLVVDDQNLSVNPKELFFGEKYGIPNLPVGIYDFSNRLITTVTTDPNGSFEVQLPSSDTYDCPTPAAICPDIYRYVANDPGAPGHVNPNYNPGYRTIGTFFEAWPGITLPADLAPVPAAFGIETPGAQQAHPAACLVNDPNQPTAARTPEFYSINKPYMRVNDSARTFTLNGQYFGTTAGSVSLDNLPMTINSWSDTTIQFTVPSSGPNAPAPGPHQLRITGSDGASAINGLTFQVLNPANSNGGYNPVVYEVGPGKAYDPGAASHNTGGYEHAIQDALDAASASRKNALVVVYPNTPASFNALGSYFENLIVHSPVKVQGVGPGGVLANGTYVPGTVLDGLGFGTDAARDTGWQATLAAVGTIIGPNGVPLDPNTVAPPEGEVVLFVANSANQYTNNYQAAIDGATIQNGNVLDFVPNVNNLGNGTQVGGGNNAPSNPNQGGGVVALASIRYLQITNNIMRSDAGAYGGAIRIGTPLVGNNNNTSVHIARNRILDSSGSNLAGGIGIFNGANNYEVNNNDICGNYSAEYGGGLSAFGLSPNSSIHDNRIYFNGAIDEAGGVMIAGEPPLTVTGVSAGAGSVTIYNNLIQGNLANDDGGGLRFLMAGNFADSVYNNMIVNNISTHEGGGVAIDNTPNIRFYNNTVMKNITTATAATSNGLPAPAGLSTAENNAYFQATLPAGSPTYSDPLLFNNIFWDNRAGTWDPALGIIEGIGSSDLLGNVDTTPINYWDMGVPGTADVLAPTNSVLTANANPGVVADPSNQVGAPAVHVTDPYVNFPLVVDPTYNVSINALPWRGNPNFIANVVVAADVPVTIMGNYHLSSTSSPAYNAGAGAKLLPTYLRPPTTIVAPSFDIDDQPRPAAGAFDIGADEISSAPGMQVILVQDAASTIYLPLVTAP